MEDEKINQQGIYIVVKRLLSKLTNEERVDIMRDYCFECGTKQEEGICQCWRDE